MMNDMISDARKVLLAGIGAVATTYEKAEEMVGQFVEKGRLTVDEGKELTKELKRNFDSKMDTTIDKTAESIENMKRVSKQEVKQIVEEYSFIHRTEFDSLKNKINELESRIKELESKNNN